MLRFFAFLMAFLCALAAPAAADSERAASALSHADQREWADALSDAKAANNPVLLKLVTWQYLLDPDSGAGFDEISAFIAANPDWPEQKKLVIRAEMSLRDSQTSSADILRWFGHAIPLTGAGKIALVKAMAENGTPAGTLVEDLVKDAWKEGDFDEAEEQEIVSTFGYLLKVDDHIARLDRLLWEDKITPAERLLPRVPKNHQALFRARIALIENKRTASSAVEQVSAELKKDPGLIYDRMRYRAHRNDSKGVREMLLMVSDNVPYPEKWWRFRELQIRKAIDEKNYLLASNLLAHHGQTEGVPRADALWLSGWLALEFLNKPKQAYEHFYQMYETVRYPVSRARAAYWAGRAAEKAGDGSARNWFGTAAKWPTTFYGQLASIKQSGTAPLVLPSEPSGSQRFESSDLVQAIRLCIDLDARDLASKLVGYLVENAASDDEAIFAAQLGTRLNQDFLSVRASKKALQRNIMMIKTGYPLPSTPPDLAVDRPLAMAIIRQESEFDPMAESPAGALGLMQLLPGTAKETARKSGITYSRSKLYDADYNMTLGSLYLSRMIDAYQGSYVMAIAAYNAGPGNVRDWILQFGIPGNDVNHALNWIEKIPFSETRNYVQRVLENLQVYRRIESDTARLALEEDLTR